MPESKRLQIAKALKTALEQPTVTVYGVQHTKPAGLTVDRGRVLDVRAAECPFLNVLMGKGAISDYLGATRNPVAVHADVFTVECIAVGPDPDVAVDPLYLWAVRAIMAETLGGAVLGGLAADISERDVEFDWTPTDESDVVIATCFLDFLIHYRTTAANPAA